MHWRDVLLRVRALLFRQQMDDELNEELQFHLQMQARKLMQNFDPAEATRQALLQFGNIARSAEECRDARGINFIETLWDDVRYALRGMRRSPMFAASVIS